MSYQQIAANDAVAAGIDPTIFVAQIQQESGFNPSAVSPAGAIGIAQFMPATAAGLGINPYDPIASLQAAAMYDANNLRNYNGNYQKMLAAYNAGGGAVNGAVSQHGNNWLAFMPQETQKYVRSILAGKTPTAPAAPAAPTSMSTSSGGITGLVQQWGEYLAIFLIAITLMIVGVMLLAGKQVEQVARTAGKAVLA